MGFNINNDLLTQSRTTLFSQDRLYWIVGGAGSGKTTVCQALSATFDIPIYDMDAHIYGAYHGRYSPTRHPVNSAWAAAPDGLAWLLNMSWEEFNNFNQATLPEYLDLLAEDVSAGKSDASLLIDGGICNPALIAQVIPPSQIVCLANPGKSSAEIWEGSAERTAMKDIIFQLPEPQQAWRIFLDFDARITQTILRECLESGITVCTRTAAESVDEFCTRTALALGLGALPTS